MLQDALLLVYLLRYSLNSKTSSLDVLMDTRELPSYADAEVINNTCFIHRLLDSELLL